MTKDEATALFERIYNTLKISLHPCTISLVYYQAPGIGKRTWSVVIGAWNSNLEWHIANEQDWLDYKREGAVIETDEDLEAYADARRSEALNDLEQIE